MSALARRLSAALFVVFLAGAMLPASAKTELERGAYLVRVVAACGNCHTPKGPDGRDLPGMELAGMSPFDSREQWDTHSPNVTPDPETGIGTWTDEEIMRAIRDGVRPDGSIIGPPMPFVLYRELSDSDTRAIVAYLRQLPAVRNEVPASVYRVPLPPAYGPPVASVPDVDPDDILARGAYLAGPVAHCIECHSPMGEHGPDIEHRLNEGGFTFTGPWGVSVSANITPGALERWSDEEIAAMITTGVRPDGSRMAPPMPYGYYAGMSNDDLDAIIAWLRHPTAR